MNRLGLSITAWLCAALIAGCAKSVTVDADFPKLLIEPLPLAIGLHYDESLANYDYTEQVPNDAEWKFQLGSANLEMFNTVFGSLFTETVIVDNIENAAVQHPGLAAVIAPQVDALEFSLPRQSQSDQYSVWIRYNLDIYDPTGNLITRWPVSAYGQSDSKMFGAEGSMELAAIRAMRDAIATIALGFKKQPKINKALFNAGEKQEKQEAPADAVAD
jgi:hypothetical protein